MSRDVFLNICLFSFTVQRTSLTCLFSDKLKYKLVEKKVNLQDEWTKKFRTEYNRFKAIRLCYGK